MGPPLNKVPIGYKWVFTLKYNVDDTVNRYKARLVTKGYTQTYGVDYQETSAPVAKMNIVKVLMLINHGTPSARCKDRVPERGIKKVYMTIPPRFEDKFGGRNVSD